MEPVQVHLLGRFEITAPDGTRLSVRGQKPRALLAYLAMQPGQAFPRERLAALLWPDSDPDHARASLRQALAHLRKALGGAASKVLRVEDAQIAVHPEGVRVDALELEALAQDAGNTDALEALAALYVGDLLEEVAFTEPPLGGWIDAERTRLRACAAAALERLAQACLDGADPVGALAAAHRAVALEPLRESAHRVLIRAHAAGGRPAEALRQLRALAESLRRELGVAPERETLDLEQRLRSARAMNDAERAERGTDTRPSVIVRAFVPIGDSAGLHALAQGISEDVIATLGHVPTLAVLASRLRAGEDASREAWTTGGRYILEGSVHGAGARVRVNARLTDAVDGRQVWAERYAYTEAGPLEIAEQVARSVSASVQTRIHLHEGSSGGDGAGSTDDPQSLVRRGLRLVYELSAERIREARALAETAVERDPQSAAAWRVASTCDYHDAVLGYTDDWYPTLERAMRLVRRSLAIDEESDLAYWLVGNIELWGQKAHRRAVRGFERALEINPSYSLATASLGNALIYAGRHDEGIAHIEAALRDNPGDPFNFFRHGAVGMGHFLAGRHEAAAECAERAISRRPDWYLCHVVLAAAAATLGEEETAREAVHAARAVAPRAIVEDLSVLPLRTGTDAARLAEALARAGWSESDAHRTGGEAHR